MRIYGEWRHCDDGVRRPLMTGEVLAANGSWLPIEFLVDCGADRTVIAAAALRLLNWPTIASEDALGGLGGTVPGLLVATQIQLEDDRHAKFTFRGTFAALKELEALDMSVLGRDITNLFAVIVDHPGDTICLLGQNDRYQIVQTSG